MLITHKLSIGLAAAAAFCAAPAVAAPVPIFNNSFELDAPADVTPTGWISDGDQTPFINDASAKPFSGADGNNIAGSFGGTGFLYQDTGVAFEPNTTYTMDVLTAHFSGQTNAYIEWGLASSANLPVDIGTPGFADAQGVWTGSGNPDADDLFDTLRSGAELSTIGSGALGDDYVYTTGDVAPAGNIVVWVENTNGNTMIIDLVTLNATSSVPEPAALSLLGVGGLALLRRRRA